MENLKQFNIFNEEVDIKPVHKSVNKQRKNPRNIKIQTDESIVESNLAEMPFINYYRTSKDEREPITSLEYTWTDSKGVNRGLEVRGSKYGVPKAEEFDILLAILRVSVKNNPRLQFNDNTNEYDMPINIEFTYRELAKELGYKNFGGSICDKITRSLETLYDTTIYNRYSGGLKDITSKDKDYINDKKQVFHLIEQAEQETKKDDKFQQKVKVQISNFFYKSMCNNYFRKFNYKLFTSLKSGVAKKLMLILVKWRNNRNSVMLYYDTLYQRIPLPDTKPDKYRNKCIKTATEELKKSGFIEDFIIDSDNKSVTFIFDSSSLNDTGIDESTYCAVDKYLSFKEVMEQFKEYGFTDNEFSEMFDVRRFEYIKALLRYCYVRSQYGEISNTKEFIKKGMEEKEYGISEKFYD